MARSESQIEMREMHRSNFGFGNVLTLDDEELLSNLRTVQAGNNLPQSDELHVRDFTVEMETGTGKTYVYLRTILDLYQQYKFTKFAIVVPSLAIREGVLKSLEITREHLRSLYSGIPYEYFVYDSTKLGQVRNFATSTSIQIMIITVSAINRKGTNVIYEANEKTGGERPIDLVKTTCPIVIVDEPQSVDGGLTGRGRAALRNMNPLCTLRYSATHKDQCNMVYRLNAVDAYNRGLVKRIEVASATTTGGNAPYIRLSNVRRSGRLIVAVVDMDVRRQDGQLQRKTVTVQGGDDLGSIARHAAYQDHRVGEVRLRGRQMELQVPGDQVWLTVGGAYGAPDLMTVHRQMIRRTIREHLEKEKRFGKLGIKILSLFFIDKVANYREYTEHGVVRKGIYAEMFEEEYRRLAQDPQYVHLFAGMRDMEQASEEAHNGYFSIDRHQRWSNTGEDRDVGREQVERAYSLIMRDKEQLLDVKNPLRFIFSHSALREGWDNPNVFQICALRDVYGEVDRRQTLGRGLRLCVNQHGVRIHNPDVNVLTVVAKERYQEFAENLQQEIESETGIHFGIISETQFVRLRDDKKLEGVLGVDRSNRLWQYMQSQRYIDTTGRAMRKLRNAISGGMLLLPSEFEPYREGIENEINRCLGGIRVLNADERRTVSPRTEIIDSKEFMDLWNRIKYKTTYRIHFDSKVLIDECVKNLKDMPIIPRSSITWNVAKVRLTNAGIGTELTRTSAPEGITPGDVNLPDLLTELQNLTHLKRRTIVQIMRDSGRLLEYRNDPRKFIQMVSDNINECKRRQIINGIKYERLGDSHYYSQQLFRAEELVGYVRNMLAVNKSLYDHVIYQSTIESEFALQLEQNETVRVYVKLPDWFKIGTPLGAYIPDWAILIEKDGCERVYFVAETKGAVDDLRQSEKDKATFGRKHFEALGTGARYSVVSTLDQLMASLA